MDSKFATLSFINFFIAVWGSVHENLRHFDTLHADDVNHLIVKKGISESDHPFNKIKEVRFKTLGRDFRLILTPKRPPLHHNFKASVVSGSDKETIVHIDHNDFYHGRVFGESESHVNLHMEDGVLTGSIHLPDEVYHIEPSWRHLSHLDNKTMITYRQSDVKFSWDLPHVCGQEGEFQDDVDEEVEQTSHRNKRQVYLFEDPPTKTKCSLLLVADYRFYREMGGGNTKATINYLISLIDRVHKIYNDTVWEDGGETEGFKGMGFVIKQIVVHNEPTRTLKPHYNMERNDWDVKSLLEVFSRNSQNKEACLAHLFTHQTFKTRDSVVLGLAYIASPRLGSHGGICTNEYFKNGYTLYLNSGLSSSRNHYGQRVITREADLVTAHEFGHNWGSEHDPDISECSPSARRGGSYLMYTYSVGGYDVNNKKFSPCSVRSIRKVLQAKSSRCFSEPTESFCGNQRVEGEEECDAGLLGTEDNDTCCDRDCKLRENAVCSDKNSPCCQDCRYLFADVKCREAQYATCEQESTCTGNSAECPPSAPMPNGTSCQERGKCIGGECVPFCETQGLQSCMCDVIADACKRCCRASMNESCFPFDPPDILADGTPCVQGFCNKGHCEKTMPDVVERFWQIIEDININKVLVFLRDNIVGTVVLVTALLWIPTNWAFSLVDKRRREGEEELEEWQYKRDLIHPSDRRKVVHLRVPRPRRHN